MPNKSMFISHGFAIHVTWGTDGRGKDQFGNFWFIRAGFAMDENNIYKFLISEG